MSLKLIEFCLSGYALVSSVNIAIAFALLDFAFLFAFISWADLRNTFNAQKTLLFRMSFFWIVLGLSALLSKHWDMALKPLLSSIYFVLPPFLLSLTFLRSSSVKLRIMIFFSLSLGASCIWAIWQYSNGMLRAQGFIDILELGSFIALLFPFFATSALEMQQFSFRQRIYFAGVSLLLLVGLLCNGTAGIILSVGTVALINILIMRKHRILFVLVSLGLLILFWGATFLTSETTNRLHHIIDQKANTAAQRYSLWQSAGHMFLDHPLLGVGLGQFSKNYREIYIDKKFWIEEATLSGGLDHAHPHNIYLHLLTETGIIGLLAFLSLYGYVLIHYWQALRRAGPNYIWIKAVFLSIITFLLCGLTENFLFGVNLATQLLWFLIGMTWNLDKIDLKSHL